MIPLSLTAREQYFELIQHYLEKEREEAVNRLIGALEDARRLIDAGYHNAVDHPSVYSRLARDGVKWVKCHRYWFGFTVDEPVIFNILWDAADIVRRVAPPPGGTSGAPETE
jgi:hypothetical protein